MKFVVAQSELSTALHSVSRAISPRPTHAVLGNVLMSARPSEGILHLTGYDLDLGISTSIAASVETDGEITLPAKLLSEVIDRQSSDSAISFTCKDEQAEVKTLSGSYLLTGIAANDYPSLPLWQKKNGIRFDSSAFCEGLRATMFACGKEESKQILTGVNITQGDQGFCFAATNGHRLAVYCTKETISDRPLNVTVPSKSLKQLSGLISGGEIELFANQGQLVFDGTSQFLISRTLDGAYPPYEKLIPDKFNREVMMDRKNFIHALERVAVIADQNNSVIKICVSDTVTLSVEAQDIGKAEEQVPATEIIGDDILIAFNVRYLLEGLKAISSESIRLFMNSETAPAVIRPVDPITSADYLYLVMPVQVRS